MTKRTAEHPSGDGPNEGTGLRAVVQSVLAAGIGVQSSANRRRDFEHGKPLHFLIGGVVGTVVFGTCAWLFVQYLVRA